jgi:hypothetical protein
LAAGGGIPNGDAFGPAVSADGRYVAFSSKSTNMVPGQVDANNDYDVFLYDQIAGTTTLVSHTAGSATTTGNNGSFSPAGISSDGRFIVYTSSATDLVTGQTGTGQNIFVFDRTTGQNTLVSHAAGLATTAGNADSSEPVISKDGNFIAYASAASNLITGETNVDNNTDVFLYDRVHDITVLVSHAASSASTTGDQFSDRPIIDDTGSVVAFRSAATDLVTGESNVDTGGNDVYRYDAVSGTNSLVSHTAATVTTTGNNFSQGASLSGDGRFVAYYSAATDLVAGATDTNGVPDVFLYDATTHANALVSHTAAAPLSAATGSANNGGSFGPVISDDGSTIAYYSDATSQVSGLTTSTPLNNVFLYNRASDTTVLVSHAAISATTSGDQASSLPVLSANGQVVAYQSNATDLVTGQQQTTTGVSNVFTFNATAETNALASHATGSLTSTGDADSVVPVISDDGKAVVFQSSASNLASGTGGLAQIFGSTSATQLSVTSPMSTVPAFTPFSVTVTALDQFGKVDTTYAGTVHFTTSDNGDSVTLPQDFTFTAADKGAHTFNGVVLQTDGVQTVTATDTIGATITGTSSPLTVTVPASSTDGFIQAMYLSLLNRAADPSGLAGNEQLIEPGHIVALHDLALVVVSSLEARTKLVDGYYVKFLGRTPSGGEDSGFINLLQQGQTPESVIAIILSSPEYFNKAGGTNQAWLNQVYHDLLGRAPDPAAAGFLTALNSGTPLIAVSSAILSSTEYRSDYIVSVYNTYLGRTPSSTEINGWLPVVSQGPQGAGNPSPDELFEGAVLSSQEFVQDSGNGDTHWVDALYETALKRKPDSGGFAANVTQLVNGYIPERFTAAANTDTSMEYRQLLIAGDYQTYLGRTGSGTETSGWVNQLQAGMTDEQVLAEILSSPEYFNKAGGTNQAWLDKVYQDVLHRSRAPGDTGLLDALNNGTMTLLQVATAILSSQEYRTNLVQADFLTYLGRAADPNGLASGVAALNGGTTDEQLIAAIISSAEYFLNSANNA